MGVLGRRPNTLGATQLFILTSAMVLVWSISRNGVPPLPGGSGTQAPLPPRWHEVREFKIYILDLSKEVAPALGLPQCDITDPEVWPLAKPGELSWSIQHMESMQHMHYQYAGQYWLTQALKTVSGVLTDNIDEACLVWVDTYCYQQWWWIQKAIKFRSNWLKGYPHNVSRVSSVYAQALDFVTNSARFQVHQGRDYVIQVPIRDGKPGSPFTKLCSEMVRSHSLVPEKSETCFRKRPKLALRETQLVPYCTVADIGNLAAPIVASLRPTFLYMTASCQKNNRNCGKYMRYTAAVAFNNTAADVKVLCTNLEDKISKSYSEVQLEMRRSTFCLLPPGDTASSNRLTETILSGCIPVFIGPPWHEMPFHRGEIDWASMAVFLNITGADWLESADCQFKQPLWQQSADVGFATVSIPDLQAAHAYLRRMPQDALQRHQAALERERPKFFYGVPPGQQISALADVVFGNLIAYGLRLKAGEYAD